MKTIRVAGAQINLRVGDLAHNEARIREAMSWAEAEGADVLLLPELAVPGYPPEDLVIRSGFVDANMAVLEQLAGHAGSTVTVVGVVDRVSSGGSATTGHGRYPIFNAAALLQNGHIKGIYHKVRLPNYGVFDEERYFVAGSAPGTVWNIGGMAVGVSICEDIWVADGPPSAQVAAGARLLLNINGSPFQVSKDEERVRHIEREAVGARVPVVYLNLVGGQDELVFDGGSIVMDREGSIQYRAPRFEEDLFVVDVEAGEPDGKQAETPMARVESSPRSSVVRSPSPAPTMEPIELIYRALVLGLGDYVRKNGFSKVVVGLSGGIDSALTAVIAVDALGRDSVRGVTMPSEFSSDGSIRDSEELARRLGIRLDRIAIGDLFAAYQDALEAVFAGRGFGIAEENLQPRIRGTLLMGISNKHHEMVIATGNKSEMAVGYATLYGDMAGGYAVLKDVLKTTVYDLANWRNRGDEVIPAEVIRKPPSAELRPGQLDTDSLPPYEVLDPVLAAYIEEDRSIDAIVDSGFDRAIVTRVAAMVDLNEYKRRQAPPGVKITPKAFGRDRRLPITNGWRGG
ncbi:NAD+ synthase [Candidatus Spongiisocius sp.]|uniref:NAD+ synthase n=1 Tax=Candidatus Spongiisocius sp. TaxID=3101273 RepID=UPI003B5C0DBA